MNFLRISIVIQLATEANILAGFCFIKW